jgi:competence protein ComEA
MKSQIKSHLSITKKEWNGIVVLIVLIALILAAPYVYQLFHKDTLINFKDFDKAVATLDKAKKSQGNDYDNNDQQTISQKTAVKFYKKALPGEIIKLNTADSAKLTELHGIGPSFARRIIGYRQRLGGFYKKEQLKEVFGLDSMTYAALALQVSVDASRIKKININTVTFDELSNFPYLSYKQMNAMIRFREEHGDYESINDLGNIAIMDKATVQKIKPYLKYK